MRKLFLAAALAAAATIGYAQDNLKDVQEKISKGKYAEAKASLDKFMADPKNANNANAYYYKAQIQRYYFQTDSTGTLDYDASKEAFNAYKKTLEMDPKNLLMTMDQNMGLFQLLDLHYNRGVKQYNNKNYEAAYNNFQKALEVQDYVRSKNFTLQSYTPPALDTQLVNLTATSAYMAKNEDAAITNWEKLANARLNTPEFKEVYALIAQHYQKKNDNATAAKYIDIGKGLYKDDDYWLSVEFNTPELQQASKKIDQLRGDISKAPQAEKADLQKQVDALQGSYNQAKIKRYEDLLQKYPNSGPLMLEYIVEEYNDTYTYQTKPADYTARQAKLQTVIDKAVALNPNSAFAYYIQSQHYYNQIFDLEEARRNVTGNTPAAAKKRVDFNAQIDKKYEDMGAASQKAFDLYSADANLKGQDKNNYRKATDQLIDYFSRKKMTDKVTFYQNKKAAIK